MFCGYPWEASFGFFGFYGFWFLVFEKAKRRTMEQNRRSRGRGRTCQDVMYERKINKKMGKGGILLLFIYCVISSFILTNSLPSVCAYACVFICMHSMGESILFHPWNGKTCIYMWINSREKISNICLSRPCLFITMSNFLFVSHSKQVSLWNHDPCDLWKAVDKLKRHVMRQPYRKREKSPTVETKCCTADFKCHWRHLTHNFVANLRVLPAP